MSEITLIAGLGNPGPQYAKTRHNAGFMLLDKLAARVGAAFEKWKDLGEYARVSLGGRDVYLARPLTYMNLSGDMVCSVARFFKIPPAATLICFDDMSLNLGEIRLRANGSAGGQKGMAHIMQTFSTQEIARLKIGIGPRPAAYAAPDFVLGKFTKTEQPLLETALTKAEEAVLLAVEQNLERAMNKFN